MQNFKTRIFSPRILKSSHRRRTLLVAAAAGVFFAVSGGLLSSGSPDGNGGLIDAKFTATSTGAAAFQVPIIVPPGVQGHQPKLSLNYSSQANANSATGVGWRLGGSLESIQRCGQHPEIDGHRSGVQHSQQDRLCLNGTRLLARNAYTNDAGYWSGNNYNKEVDDWSRTFPSGSCGNAPCQFTVERADGSRAYFGSTSDSKIYTGNPINGARQITQWLISELYDSNNNRITFHYTSGGINTAVIDRIDYNGRRVTFGYDERGGDPRDWIIGSDGTAQTRLIKRLREIALHTADGQYKYYHLDYIGSQISARSRLREIRECDASGCLDPINLSWNDQAPLDGTFRIAQPGGEQYQTWLNGNKTNIIPGDYNGDGLMDFIRQEKGDWDNNTTNSFNVYFSNGDGTFNVVTPSGTEYQSWLRYDPGANIIPGDFNGDGKTDFIRQERGGWDDNTSNTFNVYFSRGDGYFDIVTPAGRDYQNTTPERGAKLIPGDFNGDGKTDFIRLVMGSWSTGSNHRTAFRIYYSRGDGYFDLHMPQNRAGAEYQTWIRGHKGNFIPGDFNGDGKMDFIRQTKGSYDNNLTHNFKVFFSTGVNGEFDIVTPTDNGLYQDKLRYDPGVNIIPGDFNGDGKMDFIRQERKGWHADNINTFWVYFSRGNGYFDVVKPSGTQYDLWLQADPGAHIIPLDYNGDGRTDFIMQEHSSLDDDFAGTFRVYVSQGNGFFTILTPTGSYQRNMGADRGAILIPGDYDGDGREDLIRQERGSYADHDNHATFRVYFSSPVANQAPQDTLAAMQQGVIRHELEYTRLSWESATNAGVSFAAGHRGISVPMTLLKSYSRSLPTTTAAGTAPQTIRRSYVYKGATLHTGGRGFQGFQELSVSAVDENVLTRTSYHVQFPQSGRPIQKDVTALSNGKPIENESYVWQNVAGAVPASRVVQLAGRQTTNHVDEGFRNATTAITYDELGNPVLVQETDNNGYDRFSCSVYANRVAAKEPGPKILAAKGGYCHYSASNCICSQVFSKTVFEYDSRRNIKLRGAFDSTRNEYILERYQYDNHGNRTRTELPDGAVETVSYESTYDTYPASITMTGNGKSLTASRKFDARHGMPLEETDENGAVVRRAYDNFGRLTRVQRTAPQGGLIEVESHSYAREGDLTNDGLYVRSSQIRQSWDQPGTIAKRELSDGLQRVVRSESGSGSDRIIQRKDYNVVGLPLRESTPHKAGETPKWKSYVYDERGRATRTNFPNGGVSTALYRAGNGVDCAPNQLQTITAINGDVSRTTIRCQNGRGETVKIKYIDWGDAGSATQHFTRDAMGRLTGSNDGKATTTITLDSLGRRTRVVSSARGTTDYIYNERGQLATESANGDDKTFAYDDFGRETRVNFHDGGYAIYEYDDAAFAGGQGRMTRAIVYAADGSESNRREFSYNADGSPAVVNMSVDGGSGGAHILAYKSDALGRPQQVRYPSGRVACYGYNAAGFLADISVASGNCSAPDAEVFAAYSDYTALGQPKRIVYGNGVTSDFTYDDAGRLHTSRTAGQDDQGLAAVLLDEEYSWNSMNEVRSIDDRIGDNDSTFTYNRLGYLTRAQGSYGDLHYEYDANGNMTRKGDLYLTYSGSRPVSGDNGLAITYDVHGNATERAKGDGNVFTFDYDGQHKIKRVGKNGVLASSYEYDAAGQRVKKIDGSGTETIYVNRELEITRFASGRLLQTEYIQGPGGRLAAISTQDDPLAMIHGSSANHSLQAQMYNTGSIAGLAGFLNHTTMAYARQPRVANAGRALLWALAATALLGSCIYFTWFAGRASRDAYARRRRLLRWPASFAAASMFALTMQCGSSGGGSNLTIAPAGSDLFAFNFLLGPGGNGYGYPEEGTYYFQYNQVGSTSLVTDSQGRQAAATVYKPYGEIHQDASDGRDIFRGKFNDNEFDRDAELHYFNARYYDASIGSFLQADNLMFGANGDNAAGLNRYAFSVNNPVTYSDPGGNLVWFVAVAVAAAWAAAPAIAAGVVVSVTLSVITYGISLAITGESFNTEDFLKEIGIAIAAGIVGGGVAAGVTKMTAVVGAKAATAIGTRGMANLAHMQAAVASRASNLSRAAGMAAGFTGRAAQAGAGVAAEQLTVAGLHQIGSEEPINWNRVGYDVGVGVLLGGLGGRTYGYKRSNGPGGGSSRSVNMSETISADLPKFDMLTFLKNDIAFGGFLSLTTFFIGYGVEENGGF
ncbi:MAG: FG-GAP-like repeat-containing protein [bacterium]|nr:FG-GAP-like repeat-containing protein [bacterium]